MIKKYKVSKSDRELFRNTIKNGISYSHTAPADKKETMPYEQTARQDYCYDEKGHFYSNGLQQRVLKKLKNGALPIEKQIDLHGYTIKQAEHLVIDFLNNARQEQCRVVLIIHGKGHSPESLVSRLQQWLNEFLPRQGCVLAWQMASKQHGGSGASYLLLKQNKR